MTIDERITEASKDVQRSLLTVDPPVMAPR